MATIKTTKDPRILEKKFPVEYLAWQRKLQRNKLFSAAKGAKTPEGYSQMTININTNDDYVKFAMEKDRNFFLYQAFVGFPTEIYKIISINAQYSAGVIIITSMLRKN